MWGVDRLVQPRGFHIFGFQVSIMSSKFWQLFLLHFLLFLRRPEMSFRRLTLTLFCQASRRTEFQWEGSAC